ncbi:DUF1648 domain-containing protein [Bacillales bacterium AN1005]|uniref:DUF1648 domain-containing protein n=1 Tax=Niallia taxi TaxID=2499688 RepID=UPI0011A2B592|nr:DUF5808 domain-containing protein [Niallia taxi]MCT2346777.1 DUF5808 domain-containing protein [Niallia taxi]MED3965718.1 DUF5808 domain-containing protein [Niallia taxi]
MEQAMFITIMVFLTIMQSIIPVLMRKSHAFGVYVPDGYQNDQSVLFYKKLYVVSYVAVSGILILGYALWMNKLDISVSAALGLVLVFSLMIWGLILYFYCHGKLLQLKKQTGWSSALKKVNITDLGARKLDEMLPWYIVALPIIFTIGLFILTFTQYTHIPESIPTHWGANGQPDSFTEKSYFSVIASLLLLFVLQIMFVGIHEATRKSGIKISAANRAGSRIRQLGIRKYNSWFLAIINLVMTILLSFLQLAIIYPGIFNQSLMLLVPLAFLALVLIGTLAYAMKIGKLNHDHEVVYPDKKEVSDFDSDYHWKAGIFYFNKNDPSLFVEKRFGVGWTINMGRPLAYVYIFGPIILIIVLTSFM